MIISHKHKFIFIHPPKCAGTSIEVSLASVCADDDIIGPVTLEGLPDDYKHPNTFEETSGGIYNAMLAKEIKNYVGSDCWNEYFKFSVMRNPWDRSISAWHWHNRSTTDYLWKYAQDESLNEWGVLNKASFMYYLNIKPFHPISISKQLQIGGTFDIDYLIRFEDLNDSYKKVCDILNIKPIKLPNAKSGYKSKKVHYSKFYNDETKEIINQRYKDDIDNFGYKFGE
mgnify:CR=1 FL=1